MSQDDAVVKNVRWDADTLLATVAGDVDLNNSPRLRQALLELVSHQRPRKLVLDLGAVPYMDSSAIAVLVELLRKVSKLVLTNLQPRVRGILEIARLDEVFKIAANEQEALKL
jgi:anti-anti-sigma factor